MDEREKQWLLDEKYGGKDCPEYQEDLKKLQAGEPLAYVIGTMPFLDCVIHLESRPLIPRPETEYWTHKVIQEIGETSVNVLDIFAGSGCVGIAVAKHCPHAHVTFAELKPKHCDQIVKNLAKNEVKSSQYRVINSDVFGSIPNQQFDYILANPPYISKKRLDTVQSSVIDYEDPDALFTDDEGLYFVKRLLVEAEHYLKSTGALYIEFDPWQTEILTPLLEQQSLWQWEYLQDQYQKDRVLVLTKITTGNQ